MCVCMCMCLCLCVYAHSGGNLEGQLSLAPAHFRRTWDNAYTQDAPTALTGCVIYIEVHIPRPDIGGQSHTWLLSPNARTYTFQILPLMHVHTRVQRTPHAVQ